MISDNTHALRGPRELSARELSEVAGGYTAAIAAATAQSWADNGDMTDAGHIDQPTSGDWEWESDGGDNGQGGYAVYYNPTLGAYGWSYDDGGQQYS